MPWSYPQWGYTVKINAFFIRRTDQNVLQLRPMKTIGRQSILAQEKKIRRND